MPAAARVSSSSFLGVALCLGARVRTGLAFLPLPSRYATTATTYSPHPPSALMATAGSSGSKTAVLFDFDGTLGDTETPAMEVAFWELAPYLPALVGPKGFDASSLDDIRINFIQDNAGRAFEFMVEDADKERGQVGLSPIDAKQEVPQDPALLKAVNNARTRFGLKPIQEVVGEKAYPDILIQQKEETNLALAVCTVPNPGVVEVCRRLTEEDVPFCIATTSGKPRVPISVKAAGLEGFFPPHKIHSGESDFNPPKFKPDPAVYLLAADQEGCDPTHCVAVEDSGSGVGSAANAKIGMIIGYVGGTHIPEEKKDSHATMLMSGSKSQDGRGAEVVVEDFTEIIPLILAFRQACQTQTAESALVSTALTSQLVASLKGRVWLPSGRVKKAA